MCIGIKMHKYKIVIGLGLFVILIAIFLGTIILLKCKSLLDGDSVGPDIIYILSKFTLWDFFLVFLSMLLMIAGLFTTVIGFRLKNETRDES